MNNPDCGTAEQREEEKVDKSLRRMKPIPRREANIASPADSLHTESEDED